MSSKLDQILSLDIPIIVRLAEKDLSMGEVLALSPGMIIELPKNCEEELELLINNKPVGTGTACKVGENFGIKLSFIGDVRARIEALGGGPLTMEADTTEEELDADALAEQMLAGQI